jgi:hypothetical protein
MDHALDVRIVSSLGDVLSEDLRGQLVDLGVQSPAKGIRLADLPSVLNELESSDVAVLGGEGYLWNGERYVPWHWGTEGWAFHREDAESHEAFATRTISASRDIQQRLRGHERADDVVVEITAVTSSGQVVR